ncbi:calcineurin is a calcium-dependent [Phlyctema vagabunda]|uniref:Calcineurin is a calcium-dependent n=1 Tax=Phlyctema vagabunda TaxID=108571 RepID=A0ABR4PS05_9HELO
MPPKQARNVLAPLDSNTQSINTSSEDPTAKTTKRKASEIEGSQDLPEIGSDDERLQYITDNCNQVRSKIRNFIDSGTMKVGEFQRELGVSSRAYTSFMGQNGPDKGSGCDTYYKAHQFFKKRELQGIKAPKKRVKKEVEQKVHDVSAVHLDGETDDEVPVFETCDEVRKKIRAHLRKPDVTQAAFCRELTKAYHDGRKVTPKTLTDFLGKKGTSAGNTSGAFYGAYVFFEKLRVRDGKPKSKFRQEMEDIWTHPAGYSADRKPGFDTKTANKSYICRANERPHEDKYGQVTFG